LSHREEDGIRRCPKNIGKRICFFLQQEKEHGWRYDGFKDKREDKIRGVEWGLLQQDVSYVKKKNKMSARGHIQL
jgi:hypothetical protein